MNLKRNFKGQVDIIFLMVEVFAVAIAIGVLLYAFGSLFAGFQANPQIASSALATNAFNQSQKGINVIANSIVVIFIFMALASVILAAFVDSHPIFVILIIIALPVELLISFVLHDAFFAIVDTSFLANTFASYPTILVLFEYLPVICLFLAGIIAIVTFMK